MSDEEALAQVVAAVLLGALLWFLSTRKSAPLTVATHEIDDTAGDVTRAVAVGSVVPVGISATAAANKTTVVERSWLRGLLVGKDHRVSTSKTVVFAWTMVIAYGLLALIFAKWFGDPTGWDDQLEDGLQTDYLVLLGGPYAAAAFAKIRTSSDADGGAKPPGAPTAAKAAQLVTDDEGDASLSDFQYVLFNAIAILYVLGEFSGHLDRGFPDLPDLLAGLVLTSVAGYSAGKLVAAAKPTLSSVLPVSAALRATDVRIYGQHLVIPPLLPPGGAAQPALPPHVAIGGKKAEVTGHQVILGADVLTVTIDAAAAVGPGVATVVRADGVPAVGPAGSDGIAFTVTAAT